MFKPLARSTGWASLALDQDTVRGAHVVQVDGMRPRVTWVGSRPLAQPKALAALQHEAVSGRSPLVLTLARNQYQVVSLPTLEVPPDEWAAAARWKLKEHVDFATDTAAIDVAPVPGPDRDGPPRALLVVAAAASVIQPLVASLTRSADHLAAIDIPEMALRNLCSLIGDQDRAQALLHVTPTGAELVISFRGHLILSRHIELTGTLAMPLAPGPPDRQPAPAAAPISWPGSADELALARPQVAVQAEPAGAPDAAAERLSLELQRTLDVCERRFGYASLERLHLAPGAHGGALVDSLRQGVAAPIEPLDLAALIDMDALPALGSAAVQSQYLCAIGSALRQPPAGTR